MYAKEQLQPAMEIRRKALIDALDEFEKVKHEVLTDGHGGVYNSGVHAISNRYRDAIEQLIKEAKW